MKTIAELYNYNPTDRPIKFGVEIELEGINRDFGRLPKWNNEFDGSLRDNGREFIFKQPFDLGESELALRELRDAFENNNIKPKATNLTSTHIHIDVRDMNVEQLLNFIAALMVVENDLALASGEDRANNYFALSTSVSDHRKRDLIKVRNDRGFMLFINKQVREDVRYSGINFNSIAEHGSLEIRYLGGQANPMNVMPWLEFYANLKALVMKGIDYDKLFSTISEKGTECVIELFKPNFPLTMDNVIEGIRNAQDFIFKTEYRVLTCDEDGDGLREFYQKLM